MKRIVALWIVILTVGLPGARAQPTVDSQYLNIYSGIQEADGLAEAGDLRPAIAKYTDAQTQLQQFQNAFPDWQPEIVRFRLKYLAGKISSLSAQLPKAAPVPTVTATNASPADANIASADDLAALRGQLGALQSENATLLAKLKEALSLKPPAADAGELARVQEQVRSLLKENELLKAGAVASHTGAATDTNAVEALRSENAALKLELDGKNSAATNHSATDQQELAGAREQIATLQSEARLKQLENAALENRLRQLQTNAPAAVQTEQAARIRELTQERDELLANLGLAGNKPSGAKTTGVPSQVDQLNDQIRTLHDRLDVAEAQPSPYTADELALFNTSAPGPVRGDVRKKSARQLPPGSASLVAEAQSFFNAGQFDRAEADYLKMLEKDPANALVLGNLAAIEMQEGKLDDAEKHIQSAIAQDPDDAFNLATLGYLKFRREKYDEALDILSRAAKLDPQNPEVQNYLGVTLSHKGLRTQAEAALRKAIALNPDYAAAHNNLAAVYISATPPLVELARWHYQKALQAGQPHNPELEKKLNDAGVPPNP